MNTLPINSTGLVTMVGAVEARDNGSAAPISGPLLPAPSSYPVIGGNIGAEIAKLVIEMGREQRERAKALRAAEERSLIAAENAQLSAMREKADNAFCAGLVAGGAGVIGGACNVYGGIKYGANEGTGKAWSGAADCVSGAGKMMSAGWQNGADLDASYATEEEQRAGHAKRAAEDARDDITAAEKLMDKAAAFFKEYESAQQDASKAALFRA